MSESDCQAREEKEPERGKKSSQNHFGNGLSFYCSILNEICQEEKIDLAWMSNNWLALLELEGERRFIMGHRFDLNSAISTAVADDKFATYEVLRRAKIPVIEHALLYEFSNHDPCASGRNSREYVEKCFAEYGRKIVIKPNNGTHGINVFYLENLDNLDDILTKVFHQCYSASVCPFYDIKYEYRLIMLDGEARLIFRKERDRDWRFNLRQGAKTSAVKDENLRGRLTKMARAAVRSLGLRFCSVDIIETSASTLLVMEVNSGVMTEYYLQQHPEDFGTVKEIYHDAIRKMFGI